MSETPEFCSQPHVTGWYRSGLWGASQTFFKVFAMTNIAAVIGSYLLTGIPGFERSFWIGLVLGGAAALAFSIFKLNAVIER